MTDDRTEIPRRKAEHIRLAAEADVDARSSPGWDDVQLVHDALPRVDAASVDLSARFLGHTLRLPLVISAMTGGHDEAMEINRTLAQLAERHGIAIGVGSQRAALRDPSLAPTYAVVREVAPKAFVIGNVGVAQLLDHDGERGLGKKEIATAIRMVKADALALHLNYLEESVQPEGQTRAAGAEAAVRKLTRMSSVPVIAKETGAGISRAAARRLVALGVKAIDVGGLGGTSFAAIEGLRAGERGDARRAGLGERFRDWGIPTAVAVVGAAAARVPVVATGGVRSGLDAAKALALGATIVGVGGPLLRAALSGRGACEEWLASFELELRTAVFLAGLDRASALSRAEVVVTGRVRSWIDQLGYERAAKRRT